MQIMPGKFSNFNLAVLSSGTVQTEPAKVKWVNKLCGDSWTFFVVRRNFNDIFRF